MTENRDPEIQALFATAGQDLQGEEFAARVMTRIGKQKRWALNGWIIAGLALVPCAWLLAAPIQLALQFLTQSLSRSLFDVDNRLLAQMLLPVNSLATLLAFAFLTLQLAHRKIFS